MSTSFLGLPISPTNVARGTATFFGILGVIANTRALLDPKSSASTFGFATSSPTVLSANSNPFIPIAAGRAVASSLALLGGVYLKADRAVGLFMVTGGVTGFIDGVCLIRYSDREDQDAKRAAYAHWGLISVCVAVGAWMLARSDVIVIDVGA